MDVKLAQVAMTASNPVRPPPEPHFGEKFLTSKVLCASTEKTYWHGWLINRSIEDNRPAIWHHKIADMVKAEFGLE